MTAPQENKPSFTYSESQENAANPLAEIQLGQDDIAAIEQTMQAIGDRRAELADEQPVQVFAGITRGEEHGGRLLVVDLNRTGTEHPQYVVRSAAIDQLGTDAPMTEEYVADDPAHRTYHRGLAQTIQTSSLGEITVGRAVPDGRFGSDPNADSIPFAAITGRDGVGDRVVPLEDALRPATREDNIRAAQDALDPQNFAELYPHIDDSVKRDSNPATRFDYVPRAYTPKLDNLESQLRPIREALKSEELGAADRKRLVDMGHTMMRIANENPEDNTYDKVLSPAAAEALAYAEEEQRQNPVVQPPRRRFSRQRQPDVTQEQTIARAHNAAMAEYEESLQNPQDNT